MVKRRGILRTRLLGYNRSSLPISDCQLPIEIEVQRAITVLKIGNWQSQIGNPTPALARGPFCFYSLTV